MGVATEFFQTAAETLPTINGVAQTVGTAALVVTVGFSGYKLLNFLDRLGNQPSQPTSINKRQRPEISANRK
jgi:hypothetical protein